jgi:predicted O-methyltransferase YrrM
MEHFYTNIHGWTSFQNLYTDMVNKFPNGSKFVEVGTWLGRSAAYMAVEIINSKKDIDFYCVDKWEKESNASQNDPDSKVYYDIYENFLLNTKLVEHHIKPVKAASIEAALTFKDGTLDFIFLDADHSYSGVRADLAAWYPKLKSTGVIAGHDYTKLWPGVIQAVEEFVKVNKLKLTTPRDEKKKYGKPLNSGCWIIYDNSSKDL